MLKLIGVLCVFVGTLAVSSMCEETGVNMGTDMENNTTLQCIGFDCWIDAANATQQELKREETPDADCELETNFDLQSKKTKMFSQSDGQRIKGGYHADIREHPYQVYVLRRTFYFALFCGGSIISKDWILTAAHCLLGAPSEYLVRAGSSYKDEGGYLYGVSIVYAHSLYDSKTNDYDIGVMRIDGNFEYNDFVQPITLAEVLPEAGTSVTNAGWGFTSPDGSIPDSLMAVNLTITSLEFCKQFFIITDRNFCAVNYLCNSGTCPGDSGGALVFSGEQVGVASAISFNCEHPCSPTVYISVPYLRQWIRFYTGV